MLHRALSLLAISPAILALACSAGGDKTGNPSQSAGNGSGGHTSGPILKDPTAGTLGLAVGGTGSGADPGCPTSISGTVYDPAGKLPLYNVVV